MGLPGIVLPHSLDPVSRRQRPCLRIIKKSQQGFCNGLFIQRIHQPSILTVGKNVNGPAIFRCHNGQTTGGSLQNSQTERFGQRRIDEHAATRRCQTVNLRHLFGAVVLGHCYFAIEIIAVDQQQDVGQYRLSTRFHVTDVIAAAGNNQQVGYLLQLTGFTEYLQQGKYVFSFIRPRQGKNEGLAGLA